VARLSVLGPLAETCIDAVLKDGVLKDVGFTVERAGGALEALDPLQAASVGPDCLVVRRETGEVPGFDLYVPGESDVHGESDAKRKAGAGELGIALEAAAAALGGVVGDPSVWETLRIENGIPAHETELSADRLAQEASQDERAISFTKGCFTGQEVVARIHYRGHVNRLLRGLLIPADKTGAVLPGAGLARGGRVVGLVCSVTESPRFGPIALAYVRREIEPGEHVELADTAGVHLEVTSLPFTER